MGTRQRADGTEKIITTFGGSGRVRVCEECGTDFRTAEIEEKFLDELIELRDALSTLKSHAADVDSGITETAKRLKTLSKLLSNLSVLQ